jgi:hypothetical protein
MCACACVCVRACARACARYSRALCAMRYAGQSVSSSLIITVLTTWRCQFHFSQDYSHRLPSLLMCACACVCVCACVRARVCALSARALRYALWRTASLFLAHHHCFDDLTLSISLFPSLLTQAPLTAYVCVCACVRARACARYALCAMQDSQSLPCSSSLF